MANSSTIVRNPRSETDYPDAVLRGLIQKKAPTAEELPLLLSAALDKILDVTEAQAIALFTFSDNSTRLQIDKVVFAPSLYGDDAAKARLYEERAGFFKSMRIPVVKCSAGMAIMKNQCVSLDNRATSEDFYDPIECAPELVITSLAAVPVMAGSKPAAAIEIINKGPADAPLPFTETDRRYLQDSAAYIGRLIQRVRNPQLTLSEADQAACFAELSSCRILSVAEFKADTNLAMEIGDKLLRKARIFPLIQLSKNAIRAVVADPFDLLTIQDFEVASGYRIEEKYIATPTDIRDAIDRLVPGVSQISKVAASITREYVTPEPNALQKIEEEDENSALIVQLANRVIEDAHTQRASDIHIEPQNGRLVVRYRVDGVCRNALTLPQQAHRPLISRLKIMSDLDIAEHRIPQDGRISFQKFNAALSVDLRVSVIPSQNGESIVMRILDKRKSALPLSQLGFSAHNLSVYSKLIKIPHGMVLHCGPTGSGKSMTLFSALNEINSPEWKIVTVEDPVEYTLDGVIQVQTKREIGLTFASALRSFLRQDPDIILVGEIRDEETAEIAIEAAMTGHVIFSTLHTNDAPSVVARLSEMGVQPFLLTSTLVCICAQRLMRRLCKCAVPVDPSDADRAQLACAKDGAPIGKVYQPRGCDECNQTGYKGRVGIHELIEVNDPLKELIARRATTEQLKACAREHGMHTLFEDAMEKVKAGISSCAEAHNTVRPDM